MPSLPPSQRLAPPRLSGPALPIRVLHVDDDRDFVELSAAFLEEKSDALDVETAMSAEAGLERLRVGDIDCVVSDFDMPTLDGISFLRAVRETHPTLPFILFTGKGSEEVASDAISAGVTEYLQKRPGVEQFLLLANRIEHAVSRSRAVRKMEQGVEAMNAANEAIAFLNTEDRFTFVNTAFIDLFGYDNDELVGEHWSVLVPDGDQYEGSAAIDVAEEDRWTGELEFVRRDGSPVVAEYSVVSTRSDGTVWFVSDVAEKRARERALHQERQRFDLLVDAVSEYAIFMLDTEGYITSWNEGAERIKGYARDEILGEHISTFYPVDAVEAGVPEELLTRARAEGSVEDEGWRVRKDGTEFWARVTITAIRDEDGEVAGFGKVTRDLTERHRREEELRMEERFLEAALNTLEDVFYVLDTEFAFRRFNDRLAAATGYTPDALDSMSFLNLLVPEERRAVQAQLQQVLDGDGDTIEVTVRTNGGETVPFEVNQSSLHDESGAPLGIVGIGRDLSSRKEHERNLEQRTRQQAVVAGLGHRALENAPLDDLFDETVRVVAETLGADYCKVLEFDPEAENLLLRAGVGWTDGSVGTASVDTDRGSQAGYTLLSEEPIVVSDLEADPRFTGPSLLTEHDVRSGISVVIGSVDDPWGVLGVHDTRVGGFADTDVSFVQSVANILASAVENHTYRQRLERQNEQLETFARVLSHDLRNPLNVAQGQLELTRRRIDDDEHLDAIERAHDRIEEMVDGVLATVRGDGSTESADDVALSSVSEAGWEAVSTGDASLRIERDGRIDADPRQLQHVFENLFRNAAQHAGDTVTVRVGMLDDGFYVEDDGPGIPEPDRERVFEEGYTSDESGNGFGLHIVATLVAAHGWEIVATDGSDGGARFEIRFSETGSRT